LRISGFTFLRNAVINGYPFVESIKSLLPIVDEYVVAIGLGEDDTLARVRAIGDPKIRIVETVWNENMQDRGFVYGQQKMIALYNCTGDWAFYLEGDEVLHEKDLPNIIHTLEKHLENNRVEALYFDFLHFYGSPSQVGIAGYRKAPRVIRNTIRSIAPDGLFFVVLDQNKKGRYPRAGYGNAQIYHYGHCRSVDKMQEKLRQVGRYWGASHADFKGYGDIDTAELRPFSGEHPAVMTQWLKSEAELNFIQNPSYRPTRRDIRNRLRFWLEDTLAIEISKKHFVAVDSR
jgi:hypothetical protein